MSIQRWKPTDAALIVAGADVEYVTYADHVAAVAAAEQRGAINGVREMAAIRPAAEDWREAVAKAYDTGFADGVRDARDAVAAMRPETDPDIAHVIVSDVLDAIDALEKP